MEQEKQSDFMTMLESIRSEIKLLRAELVRNRELTEHRLSMIEKNTADHETRLRDVTTGVTQFRFWSSVTSGGSTAMSLLALLKSFIH